MGLGSDMFRPLLHDAAALEQIRAPVGGLDAVAVDVHQGELAQARPDRTAAEGRTRTLHA